MNSELFVFSEYCASRAMPNVQSSMYLSTLGSKLLPGIDVMWTGYFFQNLVTSHILATIL